MHVFRLTHERLLSHLRPNAKTVISAADNELLERYGAAVVECSWVRIKEVPWNKIGGSCERLRECFASTMDIC